MDLRPEARELRTQTRAAVWISCLALSYVVGSTAAPRRAAATRTTMALDSLDGLEPQAVGASGPGAVKFKADVAAFRGRRAVRLLNDDSDMPAGNLGGGQSLAIVKGLDFKDGTIEVDAVGVPRQGAPPDTRGFVGLAFRVQDRGTRFEAFYLRFTNGRADDQFRRNHATQYVSEPDFPWFRLRQDYPGVYESVRRHRGESLDRNQGRRRGDKGAAVRQRRQSAVSHRQRSETRGCSRSRRTLERLGHGGLLLSPADRRELSDANP